MNRTTLYALGFVGLAAIGGAIWFSLSHPARSAGAFAGRVSPEVLAARKDRHQVDEIYSSKPAEAEKRYQAFVAENANSKAPEVQDEVGNARLHLAYLAAHRKDYVKARTTFLEAEKEYKGTNTMTADFGGIKDQAAYQAAVCLGAAGKRDEARKAYVAFMKDYKLSPLVHAVRRRLDDLDGGKPNVEYDGLLQSAIAAQEKSIRFETSVCGPKCLEYLLKKLGKAPKDYKELAKLCGTTDSGTTMEGLRKGLKACGLQGIGYQVNREDLLRLQPPAILLLQDHYVALAQVTPSHLVVFDPLRGGEVNMALPDASKTDFVLPVLTLEPIQN